MARNKALQLINMWKDHSLPIPLKMKLLECLVWPVMLYGCKTGINERRQQTHLRCGFTACYKELAGKKEHK